MGKGTHHLRCVLTHQLNPRVGSRTQESNPDIPLSQCWRRGLLRKESDMGMDERCEMAMRLLPAIIQADTAFHAARPQQYAKPDSCVMANFAVSLVNGVITELDRTKKPSPSQPQEHGCRWRKMDELPFPNVNVTVMGIGEPDEGRITAYVNSGGAWMMTLDDSTLFVRDAYRWLDIGTFRPTE